LLKKRGETVKNMVFITILCMWAGSAISADLRVPSQYSTIQSAVDAAVSGDTVRVEPGTYAGEGNTRVMINGKDITIQSDSGWAATVIDGENQTHGFIFQNSQTGSSVVDGFTVRNCGGLVSGGLVIEENASVTIRNCLLKDCVAASGGAEGGGIRITQSDGLVEDTTIQGCMALQGGGINLVDNATLVMVRSVIEFCDGSAIFVKKNSQATIRDSTLSGNLASNISYAAGIGCFKSSTLTLERCYLTGNRNNYSDGGAIRVDQSTVTITNCIFSGNESAVTAGALLFRENASGNVHFTTFADNDSNLGSVITIENSAPVFKACIAWDPDADLEILAGTGAAHTVSYSDIRGGAPGINNFNEDPLLNSDGSYHLTGLSPCIDRGIQIGVTDDIDAESRPNGVSSDVGADEYYEPPDLSVDLVMPSTLYNPGDLFYLKLDLTNQGSSLDGIPVFCILDVYSDLFFWPDWSEFGYRVHDIPGDATTTLDILPSFTWPGGVGSASGIRFYGACTDPAVTSLLGMMDSIEFGWME
jgi:Right handed beta helix region